MPRSFEKHKSPLLYTLDHGGENSSENNLFIKGIYSARVPYFFNMIIGLTYDLKSDWVFNPNDPADANAEFDKPQTIESLMYALEQGGHQVEKIGNIKNLLAQVHHLDVDLVFNICEGQGGRNRESQVPIILEMFHIPYIGSDALTLGLSLDKILAKKCFFSEGIPTPRFFEAPSNAQLEQINHIGFPLMVKPRHEGSSKSLSEQSRVENYEGLKRQVDLINAVYHQPALAEEFIKGQEFTVAVLGNVQPQAMPVVQVSIDGQVDLGDQFYTFAHIASERLQYICPAKISPNLTKQIQALALKTYMSVGCLDLGRIDFRVDEQGQPYVLEINPLPALGLDDIFNLFPAVIGSSYNQMINQIVSIAGARHGLDGYEKEQDYMVYPEVPGDFL